MFSLNTNNGRFLLGFLGDYFEVGKIPSKDWKLIFSFNRSKKELEINKSWFYPESSILHPIKKAELKAIDPDFENAPRQTPQFYNLLNRREIKVNELPTVDSIREGFETFENVMKNIFKLED